MSDISPISRPNVAQVNGSTQHALRSNGSAATPQRSNDSVELSEAARYLSRLSDMPDIRQDLVNRVRAELAAGTYESDAKLSATLENLAEDLT